MMDLPFPSTSPISICVRYDPHCCNQAPDPSQQPAGAEVHFGSQFGGSNPSWRGKHGRRRLCPWLHDCCSVTFPRISVIQKARERLSPGCQTLTSNLHHSGLVFDLVPKGSKMFFNLPKPPETICSNTGACVLTSKA